MRAPSPVIDLLPRGRSARQQQARACLAGILLNNNYKTKLSTHSFQFQSITDFFPFKQLPANVSVWYIDKLPFSNPTVTLYCSLHGVFFFLWQESVSDAENSLKGFEYECSSEAPGAQE